MTGQGGPESWIGPNAGSGPPDPSAWQRGPQWQLAFDPRYGYTWVPAPKPRRRGCLIAFLLVFGAIVLLVGGAVVAFTTTLLPAMEVTNRIHANANGEVRYAGYNWYNGVGTFSIDLEPGVPAAEGQRIACEVVRPVLRGTKFEGDRFAIYSADGYLVADWRTTCASP